MAHVVEPVPVTVLTGFLGAGKTTLLNWILTNQSELRVGVLVNDFGAVNIDAGLIVAVDDDIISLTNGCICCSIQEDLVEAVDKVLALPNRPEHIFIEASGVVDPVRLASSVWHPGMGETVFMDSIICVVDAEQMLNDLGDPEILHLKKMQVLTADLILLNKVELVTSEHLSAVHDWIRNCSPDVRLVEASHCKVPLELLVSTGRFAFKPGEGSGDRHEHSHEHSHEYDVHEKLFGTWCYETSEPMDLARLQEMVILKLPKEVYRCKGIVYSKAHPETQMVLQVVGRRMVFVRGQAWGTSTPGTQIVTIGAFGDVEPELLQVLFDSCIVG